jgi:hypothetical protein
MKLFNSFSGGKTSGYMSWWLKNNKFHEYDDVVTIFANTGQENEETLEFVNRCDKEWGLNVVWLEAAVNTEKNKGTGFNIVSYETASRKGEPYEAMIQKYGIPNKAYPHCTRELKLQPMRAYIHSLGWMRGEYQTAIGIRVDEMDRVSSKMREENIVYPLIEFTKVTKEMINWWWERQSFNLDLPEHKGNCSWCWKKSKRKLLTLAAECPEIFEFPARMEEIHGLAGSNIDGTKRVFFRNNTSTQQLIDESKFPFAKYRPAGVNFDLFNYEMDSANGCSESCEVY